MKTKYLLLFCLNCIVSSSSFCQDFVNVTNRWHIADVCYGQGEFYWETFEYKFGEIVTIDSMDYRRLETENTSPLFELGEFYREEAGKIYMKLSSVEEEKIIYDFNLIVGDTFKIDLTENQIVYNLNVVEVDSILLDSGGKRKRLSLSILPSEAPVFYWIEGVGSLISPMNTDWMFTLDCWVDLRCYYSNNVLEFKDGDCTLGIGTTSVSEFEKEEKRFSIIPNPAVSKIKIEADVEQLKRIQIYNNLGEKLMDIDTPTSEFITIAQLETGVYYVVAQFDDNLFKVEKLVKLY